MSGVAKRTIALPSIDRATRVSRGAEMTTIHGSDVIYPDPLKIYLGDEAPERVFAVGNLTPLEQKLLAFFCSVKCPGNAILKIYDLARALRDAGVPVIGGFQTPMEKECLDLLLRGTQTIVVCPARGIEGMRLPQAIKAGVDAGRILLVSLFGAKHRRATAELADQRNRLVVSLASEVLIAYAAPGGKTEKLCREVIAKRKPLLTVECPDNANLISMGAKPMAIDEIVKQWRRHGEA